MDLSIYRSLLPPADLERFHAFEQHIDALEGAEGQIARDMNFERKFIGPLSAGIASQTGTGQGGALATVQGLATRYWAVHAYEGGLDVFTEGCFDDTLDAVRAGADHRATLPDGKRNYPRVEVWLNHEAKQVVTSTDEGLQLLSTPDGLAFRFDVPPTANGRQVLAMIEGGGGVAGMSVGYRIVKATLKSYRSTKIRVIERALLQEISVVKVGAVPGAFVTRLAQAPSELKAAWWHGAVKCRWAIDDMRHEVYAIAEAHPEAFARAHG